MSRFCASPVIPSDRAASGNGPDPAAIGSEPSGAVRAGDAASFLQPSTNDRRAAPSSRPSKYILGRARHQSPHNAAAAADRNAPKHTRRPERTRSKSFPTIPCPSVAISSFLAPSIVERATSILGCASELPLILRGLNGARSCEGRYLPARRCTRMKIWPE